MLGNIAESVKEMSKDNPSIEVVEEKTKQFLSALEVVVIFICTLKNFLFTENRLFSVRRDSLPVRSLNHSPSRWLHIWRGKGIGLFPLAVFVNNIHLQDYELTCQQVILAKEKLNKLLNSFSSKQSQLNNRDSHTMSFVSS